MPLFRFEAMKYKNPQARTICRLVNNGMMWPAASIRNQEQRMTTNRKAATAILIRDGADGLEVLLLKRSQHGVFPGMWVFPGGALDAQDHEGAEHELMAAQVAAARECMEEVGIALVASDLLPFAHWIPPANIATRFETWFFVHMLSGEQVISIDDHEIVAYCWSKPQQALELHAQGELPMAPPTVVTLHELARQPDCPAVLAWYRQRGIFTYRPRLGSRQGADFMVMYNDDAGYESGNPDTPGLRHRLYVEDGICRYQCRL